MKYRFVKLLLCTFFLFSFSGIFSQARENRNIKQENIVLVKMENGEVFKGTIKERTEDTLTLETENGILELYIQNITSIENYDYSGKFSFPLPYYTKYFLMPNAIPLEKGTGYYQNLLLTTNFINFGVTKNLSIGGGFEFVSTLIGYPIWFFNPKIGFKVSEKVHVGGAILIAGLADIGNVSLGYGTVTLGTIESNFSIGTGFALINTEQSDYPLFTFSGIHRVKRNIALITENYFVPVEASSPSFFGIHGIRIIKRNSSFDLGALMLPNINSTVFLPYAAYTLTF